MSLHDNNPVRVAGILAAVALVAVMLWLLLYGIYRGCAWVTYKGIERHIDARIVELVRPGAMKDDSAK